MILQGEIAHGLLKVGDQDVETWLHTERDLNAIVPPLTRIANRYDAVRALSAAGDEILLASALARYGSRNYIRRRRLIAEQRAAEPEPVTGRPAPEGTAPEDDLAWMAVQPPALTPKGVRR